MHVKFIARGTGSVKAAVDYLLGERDSAGHGAGRDVARAVELMQQQSRQRGPERDYGPSR